jgi:hypothetical protein
VLAQITPTPTTPTTTCATVHTTTGSWTCSTDCVRPTNTDCPTLSCSSVALPCPTGQHLTTPGLYGLMKNSTMTLAEQDCTSTILTGGCPICFCYQCPRCEPTAHTLTIIPSTIPPTGCATLHTRTGFVACSTMCHYPTNKECPTLSCTSTSCAEGSTITTPPLSMPPLTTPQGGYYHNCTQEWWTGGCHTCHCVDCPRCAPRTSATPCTTIRTVSGVNYCTNTSCATPSNTKCPVPACASISCAPGQATTTPTMTIAGRSYLTAGTTNCIATVTTVSECPTCNCLGCPQCSGPTSTTSTTSTSPPVPGIRRWGQCGGREWTGGTVCELPWVCSYLNEWYSQCL